MEENYIAIEVGGTKLQIFSGDGSGNIYERIRYTIEKENGAEGIKKQIEEAMTQLRRKVNPTAAAIGFGGPVDRTNGKIKLSFQISGWQNFDLVQWLKSKIDVPVFIENDGNVAALGEALYGAGKGYSTVFYITLGSGIGGGLVQDGKIYHGAVPGEAEIGHIRLDKRGSTMESRCSGWSVDKKVRQATKNEPESVLGKLVKDAKTGEAKYIKPALDHGDTLAKKILQETGEDIAFGLSHVVHLFHPEIIILGGGLSLIGEPLRKIVETEFSSYIMEAFLPGPEIKLSALKEDAVPIGALAMAHRKSGLIKI